jgi:hypothetical protein
MKFSLTIDDSNLHDGAIRIARNTGPLQQTLALALVKSMNSLCDLNLSFRLKLRFDFSFDLCL